MQQKAFLIKVARSYEDYLHNCNKGITLGYIGNERPKKEDIRELLQATFENELAKQHIPFEGKTTDKKMKKRNLIRELYCDCLEQSNYNRYMIKDLSREFAKYNQR